MEFLESFDAPSPGDPAPETEADFDSVVDRYYAPLFKFAYSLTHSEADACDLTQQAFYIWTQKRGQLRDGSKVKSWLFTTLHRTFLQTKRRETRYPHQELDQAEAQLPTVSADEARSLDSSTVVQALAKVDDMFRVPLSLFYLEDYAYKDIADILEIPLGTVKSRMARGIVQLKAIVCGADRSQTLAA